MTYEVKIEEVKRGQKVSLAIPAMRPIELQGVLHRSGDVYKVLGLHGTCVRISRCNDCAKLIVTTDMIHNVL